MTDFYHDLEIYEVLRSGGAGLGTFVGTQIQKTEYIDKHFLTSKVVKGLSELLSRKNITFSLAIRKKTKGISEHVCN